MGQYIYLVPDGNSIKETSSVVRNFDPVYNLPLNLQNKFEASGGCNGQQYGSGYTQDVFLDERQYSEYCPLQFSQHNLSGICFNIPLSSDHIRKQLGETARYLHHVCETD